MTEPLRVCLTCGREALSITDLESFVPNKPSKFGRQNQCVDCYRKYMREYRPSYYPRYRTKFIAYQQQYYRTHPKVRKAQNKTRLKPLANQCQICDSTKHLLRHHPDYVEPTFFVTLCAVCHAQVHRKEQK